MAHAALAGLWNSDPLHSRAAVIAEYERALALDPKLAAARISLARLLADQRGRESEAIDHLRLALGDAPESMLGWQALGSLLARNPETLPEAASALKKAIALDPQWVGINFQLGQMYDKMPGHLTDAAAAYLAETFVAPDNAEAYCRLGSVFLRQHQYAEAVRAYRQATKLVPDEPRYWKDLSVAHWLKKEFDAAANAAERMIELQPDRGSGYLARGSARRSKGNHADALADYLVAARLDPPNSDTYLYMGWCREELKQREAALADYSRAIELNPDFPLALSLRAALLQKQNRLSEALSDISRAIALDGTKAPYWDRRGVIRLAQSDPAGAIPDFIKATELAPADLGFWDHRTQARLEAQDYAGVVADLDHVLALGGGRAASVYYRRGLAKAALQDREGARADFDLGIALDPKASSNYLGRANLRELVGDFAGALADYERVLQLRTASQEYERLWCALLRRRLHLPASDQDLPFILANSTQAWAKALAAYLGGSLSEADLETAHQALPEPDRTEKSCELYYYTGLVHLLENDMAGARARFQQSVDTNVTAYHEHACAQAELLRMH